MNRQRPADGRSDGRAAQARRAAAWAWAGVLALTAVTGSAFWGAPAKGDDLLLHVYRIPALNNLWAEGVFFSRWLPDLVFGYGSPLFNFYPPLSAYLLTLCYRLGGENVHLGLAFFWTAVIFGAAAGMFVLGRRLFNLSGGLLATAAYLLSPFFLLQISVRASLSNALALALYPWVLWGFLRLLDRPQRRRIAMAATLLLLLFLTHLVSSLLFATVLLLLLNVGQLLIDRRRRRTAWRAVHAAFLLGLALSAFFWLPALGEIGFTKYAAAAAEVDFRAYFGQIWGWPGPAIAGLRNAALPKSPGIVQLVAGTLISTQALWQLSRRPASRPAWLALSAAAGVISWGVLFLASPLSTPIWAALAPLRDLQFPWRLLDLPTFLLALASGAFFCLRPPPTAAHRRGRQGLLLSALLLLFGNGLPYLYPAQMSSLPATLGPADMTAAQQQFQIYGLTAWGEYSAAQVSRWPPGPPFGGADEMASLADKLLNQELRPAISSSDPWRLELVHDFARETTLTFAAHYFPGWQASVDGRPLPAAYDAGGALQLTVPAGEHAVRIWFGMTPLRRLATIVSAAALALLAALVVGPRTGRQKEIIPADSEAPPARQKEIIPAESGAPPARQLTLLFVLLLLVKVGLLDRVDTPLVRHPQAGVVDGVTQPESGEFGPIRLSGYALTPPDQLTLYWYAPARPERMYTVEVTLADARGAPLQVLANRTPGENVTSTWEPGQLTRDSYRLPLDRLPAPAGYRLFVSVRDPQTGRLLPLQDGPQAGMTAAAVGTFKRPPPPPFVSSAATPVDAVFGQALQLAAAAAPTEVRRGESMQLQFFWRSLAPVDADYTVFLHLLHADGTLAAGNDGQPLQGLYPTSFWEPDEQIVDNRSWLVDLPAGVYQLQLGFYELQSGQRLLRSDAAGAGSDRLILQELVVR